MGNASEEAQGKEIRKAMSRRKLLSLAVAGTAGLVATQLTGRVHALPGQNLIIGQHNCGDDAGGVGHTTWLDANGPLEHPSVLMVDNTSTDPDREAVAIHGQCKWAQRGIGVVGQGLGIGVWGQGLGEGVGVRGESLGGIGVEGFSNNGFGVLAASPEGIALQVDGKSQCGADVIATAPDDPFPAAFHVSNHGIYDGVYHPPVAIGGYCPQGVAIHGCGGEKGVYGTSEIGGVGVQGDSKDGIGILATSDNGLALQVTGRSSFSTVGSGTIPRGRKSFAVEVEPGFISVESHISVTLTSNPNILGKDAAVSYVKRDPTNNRFIINLDKRVGKGTTFTYFIVEP